MRWDLYCRVVDNFGDIGVAWRLAADLAARGEIVRLAVDDAAALVWMAPAGAAGVTVHAFDAELPAPVDVVVELFGAGLPTAAEATRALRINVEHLSAESYAERSHGLPRGVGPGATWYFYPGFNERTGGLLREPGLANERAAFGDGSAWLNAHGIEGSPSERRVSLFCYGNEAVGEAIDALAGEPTLLLAAPGPATTQVRALLGPSLHRGALRAVELPWLAQTDFDRLLWSCDLNFVRGEDSLLRAVWASRPFVWQLYKQNDGAQFAKLDAFLGCFLAGADARLATALRACFLRWNGGAGQSALSLPPLGDWLRHVVSWRGALVAQRDLTSQLIEFAISKR